MQRNKGLKRKRKFCRQCLGLHTILVMFRVIFLLLLKGVHRSVGIGMKF